MDIASRYLPILFVGIWLQDLQDGSFLQHLENFLLSKSGIKKDA